MTLSLRQKRRQETAHAIQTATLELAIENGLENITTEEIAAAAGVSTRTFFNYFTNKEAAAIGTPPGFLEEDKAALRDGTAPLAEDLKRFLDKHMETLAEKDNILRMVGKVLRSNEKARGILDGFLTIERDDLTECLMARVENRQVAAAVASNVTNVTARAIHLWEHEPDRSLGEALDTIWEGLIVASHLLAGSSDQR
ncbi:TetR/AcrR family transcriptional regulator [Shimia thalassica]|uniref:TetR/AcrR family transcriptional regulator n=1 Tax=Shimia thalassica TaxID=1715693 RepID=UPI0026E302D1|nr:TetR/AcrR family transcriptional regulator [Shimia thalassica]MDO6480446.1 TetR/AcrR family transcriptional regulator [Shimia thalassica]